MAYIPAPGSPTRLEMEQKEQQVDEDEEDDPLDAYMAGIEKEVGAISFLFKSLQFTLYFL